ncbi:hypothetical protein T12_10899 [Trichinella patagoniensis]|uniref:Uncharacterized protein n=1 Tax=Trichinella patagoniensis TaxID=990121 RepID=A0A0V1A9I9_9BILA|nr:hypothetical protein T12_10899 [Trichinella patagoniensis]
MLQDRNSVAENEYQYHLSFIYPVVQLSLYAHHLTERKLIYLKSLEFPAKRQHCGWHFRYRHPDIAGNCLAHVFTDITNPLKMKKDCGNGLFLIRHLVSCLKEEEDENLAKMASLFIDRIHPMQGEETRRECTKSEFSPCHSKPLKKLAIDLQSHFRLRFTPQSRYAETTPHLKNMKKNTSND